jgi:hypothetical protein
MYDFEPMLKQHSMASMNYFLIKHLPLIGPRAASLANAYTDV